MDMKMCMVMQKGFQFATGDDHCILFLFQGWNIDNHAKYAGAVIGVFFMGLLNGALVFIRHFLNSRYQENSSLLLHQLYLSVVYGIQIVFAYWLMLLVMTYETGIFISLIFGLVIGHFLFGYIQARNRSKNDRMKLVNNSAYESHFNSTPCCEPGAS